MQNVSDFSKAATQIATRFVDSGGDESINDLSVKVAQQSALNPDGVRTLVRMANVVAFEKLMAKSASNGAEDRMIEYQTGDPEEVLLLLGAAAEEKIAAATPQQTTHHYDQVLDFFGDTPTTAPQSSLEKVATSVQEDPAPPRVMSPREARLYVEKAAQSLKDRQGLEEQMWLMATEKAASLVQIHAESPTQHIELEKAAIANCDADVIPELRMVRELLRISGSEVCGGEKIAALKENHVSLLKPEEETIIETIKEASSHREQVNQCARALEFLKTEFSVE